MRYVKLKRACKVRGHDRNPEDGLIFLPDDEAKKLVKSGDGDDVTDDFTAAANNLNPPYQDVVAEAAAAAIEPTVATPATK